MSLGLPDRIEKKISPEPNTGCWLWMGAWSDSKDGYGGARHEGKTYRAHRLVYELVKGPIPTGYTIDHLCRCRLCVNPEHLEAVTRVENVMRGEGACAKSARKTHCPQGHEYTPETTYMFRGHRYCRPCHKIHSSNHARKKAQR